MKHSNCSRLTPRWKPFSSISLVGSSTVPSLPTESPKPAGSWSSRCHWQSGLKELMCRRLRISSRAADSHHVSCGPGGCSQESCCQCGKEVMLSLAPMKKGMSLTTVKAIVFSLGRDTHKDHHVKNINSELSQIRYPECLKLNLYCSHCLKKKSLLTISHLLLPIQQQGLPALGHSQFSQIVCIHTVFKARSRFIHKGIYSTLENFTGPSSSDRLIFNIVASRRVQLRHLSFCDQWPPLAPNSSTLRKPMNISKVWLILGIPC